MNHRDVLRHPIFNHIQKVADEQQLATYVIGGFVRDALLNKPCKDIDIVCVGDALGLAQTVATRLKSATKVITFKNFGTAMFKWRGWQIEFVSARRESYKRTSRHPTVVSGTLEDDQKRRDFTLNTLALSLNQHSFGQLKDPFNGQQHLHNHIIKTPRDAKVTFTDDPLRMMRAIRLATQLDFCIAHEALSAITACLHRLAIVSQERITEELNKIIASKKPAHGFRLLDNTGLLKLIFPELVALKGQTTIDGQSHKDNFSHTLQVLTNVAEVSNNLWLRWAALLHDIAKPHTKRFVPGAGFTFHGHEDLGARMVPGIFRRMRLPLKDKMHYVQKLVGLHRQPIALVEDQVTDSAVRRLCHKAGEALTDLMLLCRADITSKNHQKVRQYLHNFEQVEAKIRAVSSKDYVRNLQPVITGEVIMKTFDLTPCSTVGTIKQAIKNAILDGTIQNTYTEAYAYMLETAKRQGLVPCP